MPHRRGQGRGQVESTRKKTANKRETGGLDNAYRDMLAEAAVDSSSTQTGDEGRPIKRRRIRGQVVTREGVGSDPPGSSTIQLKPATIPQTTLEKDHDPASLDDRSKGPVAIAATESLRQEQTALKDDSSDESDFAWEEVDLAQEADQISIEPTDQDGEGALELFLDGDENKDREATAAARRKPLTAAERKLRLEIHKVHLLCLLSHVHLRNHWCNDQNVHTVRPNSKDHATSVLSFSALFSAQPASTPVLSAHYKFSPYQPPQKALHPKSLMAK
ncbi:MAG: hypothetical protein Q9188_007626 [Gyalolechia gomerana]